MAILFSNFGATTLASPISTIDTTMAVAAGTGSLFPSPTAPDYFVLVLTDAATGTVREVIHCTARSGDSLTIVRAQEGTTAQNWLTGDYVDCDPTAGTMSTFQTATATAQSTADTANATANAAYLNGVVGKSKNLKINAPGNATSITVTADEVMLENSSHNYYVARSASLTINTAASGANGLDTGAIAASTWYAVWIIYNPSGPTTAGLVSLSSTAPTLPTGYTFSALLGYIRTDGSTIPMGMKQNGNDAQWVLGSANVTTLPEIASGTAGNVTTPTWVAKSVSNFVPSAAISIRLVCGWGNNSSTWATIIAPNNSYGGYTATTTALPPIVHTGSAGYAQIAAFGEFNLESTNIYYASTNSAAAVGVLGWRLSL